MVHIHGALTRLGRPASGRAQDPALSGPHCSGAQPGGGSLWLSLITKWVTVLLGARVLGATSDLPYLGRRKMGTTS